MSRTFVKLFGSITESTVWAEPHATRIVWITLMSMTDEQGRVWASVPGLAHRARVTLEECEVALARFLGPDLYSRTPAREGRRIEKIDGGWRLLNYLKFRDMRDDESRREYMREYMQNRRRDQRVNSVNSGVNNVSRRKPKQKQKKKEKEKKEHRASGATRARVNRTLIPDGFDISERVRSWAAERGISRLEEHLQAFKEKSIAKAYTYACWDAAFMQAIRQDWAGLAKPVGRQGELEARNREVASRWAKREGGDDRG